MFIQSDCLLLRRHQRLSHRLLAGQVPLNILPLLGAEMLCAVPSALVDLQKEGHALSDVGAVLFR